MTTELDALRPPTWNDYIGQEMIKGRLDVIIDAANAAMRRLDHTLLLGPPGSGKTSFASLIADRSHRDFIEVSMPVKIDELALLLEENADYGPIILLDELHNASARFQEMLQPALYEGRLTTPDHWTIDVSQVTFLGATTTENRDKLIDPLVQRFPLSFTWQSYSDEEMTTIVANMAHRLKVALDPEVAAGIARAAGGTPRYLERLVKRARDLQDTGRPITVEAILDLAGVDRDGLTHDHLEYLRVLRALGKRAGLDTLKTVLRMSPNTLLELERLLLLRGYIRYSSSGRQLLQAGAAKVSPVRDRAPA